MRTRCHLLTFTLSLIYLSTSFLTLSPWFVTAPKTTLNVLFVRKTVSEFTKLLLLVGCIILFFTFSLFFCCLWISAGTLGLWILSNLAGTLCLWIFAGTHFYMLAFLFLLIFSSSLLCVKSFSYLVIVALTNILLLAFQF